MNYVITPSKNGGRVHRATCKRKGDALPLATALAASPALLEDAKSAGCCKPKEDAWQAELEAARPAPKAKKAPAKKAAVKEIDPDAHRVDVAYTQLAKHFWPQARDGALAIADVFDLDTIVHGSDRIITLAGDEDAVERAEEHITTAWNEAKGYLDDWKAQNVERHRTLPNPERWGEYHRYLQQYFGNRAQDAAKSLI